MIARLFHGTSPLHGDFQDTSFHVAGMPLHGVWLSECPRPTLPWPVVLDIDPDLLNWYRVESRTSDQRGWCIPAEVLNVATQTSPVPADPVGPVLGHDPSSPAKA